MTLLLGIDLGQTSTKVTALTLDGTVAGSAAATYPVFHPGPGAAEQDPDDWVEAVGTACRELWAGGVEPTEIAAVGLSSATHHGVLLGGDLRPLRPCILLTDSRSAPQAAVLERDAGELILRRARNPVSPTWTLPQMRWIAETEPDTWAKLHILVFAKDVVRLALTGSLATDRIDAEGSLLLDAHSGRWDPDLLALAGLRADQLPEVHEPTEVTGFIDEHGSALTGLPPGVPVVAGASDTAAEGYAAGAVRPGAAVVKIATAGNVNVMVDRPQVGRHWLTYSHPVPGLAYHCQATNSAATSLGWWQRACDIGFKELIDEAGRARPGSGGVLFHPYLLGERSPVWNPDLRACFTGVSATTSRGDLTRAVLEGVALSLAECAQRYAASGINISTAFVLGGGARTAVWRQIAADVLGIPLVHPALTDASAGAALIAGAGAGLLPDLTSVPESLPPTAEHRPDPRRHEGYRQLLDLYTETRDRTADLVPRLARIDYGTAPTTTTKGTG